MESPVFWRPVSSASSYNLIPFEASASLVFCGFLGCEAYNRALSTCAQGIAIIRLLRQLEQRTGRRIHELFDLVCGTSTGGILAVALALKQLTLEDCEQIYR